MECEVFVGAYRADGTQDPDLSSKLRLGIWPYVTFT